MRPVAPRARWVAWLGVAAIAVVVVASGPFLFSKLSARIHAVANAPQGPSATEPPPVSVAASEPATLTVADGTPADTQMWGDSPPSKMITALSPLQSALPSQFRVQRLTVSGRVREPVVRAELMRQRAAFEACHLPASSARAKGTSTELVARWVIGRTGAVSNVSMVKSELRPDGDACVTRAIQGLKLPAPEAGIATVSADLDFTQS